MSTDPPKAECLLCNGRYADRGMTKHLQSCVPASLRRENADPGPTVKRFLHILVKGKYLPEYWMHLKVAGDARLEDLDRFLRDAWLECCGHMSAFRIERNELKKSKKLRHALRPGMELVHEYDFGATTELTIKVVAEYDGGMPRSEPIWILARNEPPEILCDECGKSPAVEICTECQWDGGGWLCQDCLEDHECGGDMLLPVVNSPRTGVCGYAG